MEFLGDITGNDPNRPSLFELVAQEQLRDTLQPAIKYILAVSGLLCAYYFLQSVHHPSLGFRSTVSSLLDPSSEPF